MAATALSSAFSAQYSKLAGTSSQGSEQRGAEDDMFPAKVREYELCMVFPYKVDKSLKFEELGGASQGRGLKEATQEQKDKMEMWAQKRDSILKSLQNCGLSIFCYYNRDRDEIIVKIGASAQKLRTTAYRMKYRLQLKEEYLDAFAEFRHDFPGRAELNYTDRRVVSHLYKTHGEDDYPGDDAIFKTTDKIMIINHIITSKDKDCAGINVGNMMHGSKGEGKELLAYFPLHEEQKLSELRNNPFGWIFMGTEQANKIHDYFGDKVAYYYLFMSYYWKMLVLPGLVGILLQVVDLMEATPDNSTTVPFCVLLSTWALFMPHFWRRQEAKYAIAWGNLGLEPEFEPARPAYYGEPRINPVTAQVEPYYPFRERLKKYIFSFFVMIFVLALAIGNVLMLMILRHLYRNALPAYGRVVFQVLTAAAVEIVNYAITKIVAAITDWENHRTQNEFETSFLIKTLLAKFVNSFSALYYLAFFKEHFKLGDYAMECGKNRNGEEDCLLDLQAQLGVFVLFHIVVQNIFEVVVPQLRARYRGFTLDRNRAELSGVEQQAKKERYNAFSDFDETLVTHGYATLFAVAAPWVCIAVCFGVMLEIFLDMRRLTSIMQRPMPLKCRNNEPWDTAFEIYGALAAFTNVFLAVFTSKVYEGLTSTEKIVWFIFMEHCVILIYMALKSVLPEVPSSVTLLQMKQDNLVHRSLENIKVEETQDYGVFNREGGELMEVHEQDMFEEEERSDPTVNWKDSYSNFTKSAKDALMDKDCFSGCR
mmetsp:Transcript_38893/g.91588  ORF Transcript_38893/g.91588 Transcript_38893/m.91588 type:complete len:764 (-) Transcript_38893:166-2457(-)